MFAASGHAATSEAVRPNLQSELAGAPDQGGSSSTAQGPHPRRILLRLAVIATLGTSSYELARILLFPHLTLWHVHVLTIVLLLLVSILPANYLMRRQLRPLEMQANAEDALRAKRKLLRTLIDNLPDYIYVKDAQSRFVVADRALAQLVGVRISEDLNSQRGCLKKEGTW